MRAAIYTRVSTEDQARDGYGLEVQRERCVAYAVSKAWQVVAEYTDEGISGAKDESARPGLAGLLDAVAAGELDAVVVLALDRIGRRAQLALRVTDQIQAANVVFASVKESIDTSTPTGRMFRTMLAGMAEFERDLIVERTTAGREARGRKDGERGGRVPMGYRRIFRDGKAQGVTIAPAEAATVKAIFKMRERGATLQQIADRLNADGELTRRGKPWTPSSLHYVVRNRPKYEGRPRGQSAERWPAILGR